MNAIIIDVSFAARTSLEEAIIISNINHSLSIGICDFIKNDQKFVLISDDYLRSFFEFWNIEKIKRIINKCIKNGLICKLNHPEKEFAYFGLTEKAINLLTKRI